MAQALIARHNECKQIEECIASGRSEFVIVCGRRRIGKTFLVDSFFGGRYDFTFVGSHRARTQIQLRQFAKALKAFSGKTYKPFADWYDAFSALEEYIVSLPADRRKVLFIDEMPWIDTRRSTFVSALEDFWNGWANRRSDILLIASGSATSWMADNLISNQGGLHNRITQRIFLKPFTLAETEEYIRSRDCQWSRYDIVQCYMLTGGVPYYLSLLDYHLSIAQNIDRLCFDENGALHREYDELYNALFTNAEAYIRVVQTLYRHKKGMERKEIVKATGMNGLFMKTVLSNLAACDFISCRQVYGKTNTMEYRLKDFYTLFYLKFIAGNHDLDKEWWTHHLASPGVKAWEGLTFELICMEHCEQIKRALGISGMATAISTWRSDGDEESGLPGTQIDMIIERADRIIHLCEMKFSEGSFNISADYEKKLRERADLFKLKTKTKKAVVHTFITTYGIGQGKHSDIVHSELTMDELFH